MEWTLEVVPVPVTDIDRAKHFYAEQVGFTVDHDTRRGEARILQLTPPGSGCSIVIGTVVTMEPGSLRGVQLVVPDIEAARERLLKGGVDASKVHHYDESGAVADGPGGRWNSFVHFSDPDGNQWVIQESPADR
ncbi:VOC family protein [Actinomadura sp. 21ATH]|uniref:VOC family protein n=1 Tax=Actinomadura sp. 21ATH TaxID=1735444 RepID=UPI0035C260C9